MEFVPPTSDEISAVARLKEQLFADGKDLEYKLSETALLRFYRGRKQDFEKAYRAILRHLQWRKDFQVDSISNDKSKSEKDQGKLFVEGYDVHGRPCVTILARKHNASRRNLEALRYLIIETLEETLSKTRPEDEKMVICFDLTGFSYSCMDNDALKVLIDILSFNYPETLSVAYVVNPPFYFSACWAVIRPWLDPVTAKKAIFVRKDQLEKMEVFDAERMPSALFDL